MVRELEGAGKDLGAMGTNTPELGMNRQLEATHLVVNSSRSAQER